MVGALQPRTLAFDPVPPVFLSRRDLAEAEARRVSETTGAVYVSPYNDLDVVAGQGTVAVELGYQVPPLDALILSIGGGGLASGVGAWARARVAAEAGARWRSTP